MKYCPLCGNLLDGKFDCSCGWSEEPIEYVESTPIVTDFKTGLMSIEDINKSELISNISKIHTTEQGIIRIKNNLKLDSDNVVDYLINKIKNCNSIILKKGKNYYVEIDNIIITINSYNYCIITAHTKN